MCKPVQITFAGAFYFMTLVHAGMGQLHPEKIKVVHLMPLQTVSQLALAWLPKPL